MAAMRRGWGFPVSLCSIVFGLALWQPATGAAASCAPGRPELNCSERTALYYDAVNWAVGGFGSLDMFQAKRVLHLNNPALAQFWHFEAATAITRYEFEIGIGSQGNDGAYETPATAAHLRAPKIRPSGIVGRHTAFVLARLLAAEQQEVVNLVAMDVALNRATGAQISGRPDWASYQTYSAAGLARRAAAAIGEVIPRQRAVTRALRALGLKFGVGPADTRAEQRYVRKHGFPAPVARIMLMLGNNAVTMTLAKSALVHAKPTTATYNMSQYLSSAGVIRNERNCARALVNFANGVSAAPRPS
jgi:hypothetical protein